MVRILLVRIFASVPCDTYAQSLLHRRSKSGFGQGGLRRLNRILQLVQNTGLYALHDLLEHLRSGQFGTLFQFGQTKHSQIEYVDRIFLVQQLCLPHQLGRSKGRVTAECDKIAAMTGKYEHRRSAEEKDLLVAGGTFDVMHDIYDGDDDGVESREQRGIVRRQKHAKCQCR